MRSHDSRTAPTLAISAHAHALAIAANAFDEAEIGSKQAVRALKEAYGDWKESRGLERVERTDEIWDSMMADTKAEYVSSQEAKRQVRNARSRLATAARRYRECV